ncbi:AAA family ATPase [Mariprofundus ferrooxydans]|uniref:Prophage MuSo1, DNA transposition protein, putative n=1 Tax=Mariprofundus ferrooxydans PV-1 TaxID=314345 RepID=Q0EWB0_9PROT|nr:ATP-binding protein [Mariprofundus ferrooxydans]EAU53561.1 prophage MuSo1, DNA transposition protein, putative [Mariprofundus ferrooxydans PV-1]KON46994.1 DNA transposition protein [Mariprofundus ferrooxydans]
MRSKILKVKNVARLTIAGEALTSRSIGMPGMGLIYGPTGAGKTTAITWYINQCNGVYVRAWAVWSPSAMLEAISSELNLPKMRSLASMAAAIVAKLEETGRPLFIDEADYVIEQQRMVETLRDLHDMSAVPVILIGMEGIHRKIQARKQVSGRLAEWVEFTPCDLDDARLLADGLCEVIVDDDLLAALHKSTHGLARNMTVGLSRIEARGKKNGKARMSLADWPKGEPFFVGPEVG